MSSSFFRAAILSPALARRISDGRSTRRGLADKTTDVGPIVVGGAADLHWDVTINGSALGLDRTRDLSYLRDPVVSLRHFNLRSFEFGNWMTELQRQEYHYGTMEGFVDLARIVGVPQQEIGMGGRLSMAYGARGTPGALAHYERHERVVINLSKARTGDYNGKGALAHEYGHAIDNMAAMLLDPKAAMPWLSGGRSTATGIDEEKAKQRDLFGAMERFFQTLFWKNGKLTPWITGMKRLPEYWRRRNEIWARTFDFWVSRELQRLGIRNKWLSIELLSHAGVRVTPTPAMMDDVDPLIREIVRGAFALFRSRAIARKGEDLPQDPVTDVEETPEEEPPKPDPNPDPPTDPPEDDGWLPMSSAPKDGTWIQMNFGTTAKPLSYRMRWKDGYWRDHADYWDGFFGVPIGWRPDGANRRGETASTEDGWLPMSSAPKDGTVIEIRQGKDTVGSTVLWKNDDWVSNDQWEVKPFDKPTAWRPVQCERASEPPPTNTAPLEIETHSGTHGDTTFIATRDRRVPARYRVRELDELIPSHDPHTFAPNARYPGGCQQRDYTHDKAEQAKVQRNATSFEPAFLISNAPTATDGPPIVTPAGVVLGGNSRTMSLMLVEDYEPYRRYLARQASAYGISERDITSMRRPVLVREVTIDMAECSTYSNILNKSLTQELDITTEAISFARQVTPGAIDAMADAFESADADTLAEALRDTSVERKVTATLRQIGIINDQNVSQWIDPATRRLSDLGRLTVEKLFVARVLRDKKVIDAVPAYTGLVAKSAPILLRMQAIGGEWDITSLIEEAIRQENKRRQSGSTRDEFIRQKDAFSEDITPSVIVVWNALEKPRTFKAFIESYVKQAERESQGPGFGFDEGMSADELLRRIADDRGLAGCCDDGPDAVVDVPSDQCSVTSLADIYRLRGEPLAWSPRWKPAMGNLPSGFLMLVWGWTGQGKSTFALDLSVELSRFGRVLYATAEERLEAGMLGERARLIRASSRDVDFTNDTHPFDRLERTIEAAQYRFVVLDSINYLLEQDDVDVEKLVKLRERHPGVSVILVAFSDKDKTSFVGHRLFGFASDVVVRVDEGIASIEKNKYGRTPVTMKVFPHQR